MKSTFTLFVVLLFAVSLFGQPVKNQQQSENLRDNAIKILKKITNNTGVFKSPFNSSKDSKQAMDSLIYEEFSESNGWYYSAKETYTWNENGQQAGQTFSANVNENREWFPYHKEDYTYDNQNKLTMILTQERDIGIDWMNISKTEFTYDGSTVTVIMNYFIPDSSQWVAYWKYEYLFNDNGAVTEITIFINGNVRENWVNGEKMKYFYNDNGNLTQEIDLKWNAEENDWDNNYKNDYTYDEGGFLESAFFTDWNKTTSEWVNDSKSELTVDEYGNIVEYINWSWDSEGNDYYTEDKGVYVYNNDFSYNQLLIPDSYLGYFYIFEDVLYNHMLVSEEYFEASDNDWDEDSRTTYYYSEHNTSGVDFNKAGEALAYPNPATDFFSIDLNNGQQSALVEIYDISGRIVFSKIIESKQPISLAGFEPGIYLYKIIGDNTSKRGKLIVEK